MASNEKAPNPVNENDTMVKDEPVYVDWDGPDDLENPQNWPLSRKWWLVGLVSAVTFNM